MRTLTSVSTLALIASAFAIPLLTTTPAAADDLQAPPPIAPQTPATQAQPGPIVAGPGASSPDESKDTGLGLEWVWLNAEAGFSYMDLKSAKLSVPNPTNPSSPISVVDSTTTGEVFGFGAGVRVLFLTVGLRARNFTAMNLWQIDGEVGFHGRMGRIDPYLAARFGYDTVGTLSQAAANASSGSTPPDISVHGLNGGLAFGIDYYFSHLFSLGVEASGDVVYLQRPAASLPAPTAAQQTAFQMDPQLKQNYNSLNAAYQQSGSSVGFGGGLTAHVGIHF